MRLVLMIVLGAMLLTLPACVSTTVGSGRTECHVWRPVSWSAKDTDQTIAEVKGNNARRAAWCE